jgi:azurin
MVCRSTVRITDGQTVTLAGMTRQAKRGTVQRFVRVTAHVLPIGGGER